jgi:2-octaprenyl-6-methoxyphenol hydroxylase
MIDENNDEEIKLPLIISGAGPAGLLMALTLARLNIKCIVLDPVFFNNSHNFWHTTRTIALSNGSIQILNQHNINVYQHQASQIKHVHISILNAFGACNMHANEHNVAQLGCVISYAKLCYALYDQCIATGMVQFIAGKLVEHTCSIDCKFALCKIEIALGDILNLSTSFVIISEGVANDGNDNNSYSKTTNIHKQVAHVGWIRLDDFPVQYAQTAFERFTTQGPLAILPYIHHKYTHAIVWCMHKDNNINNIQELQKILGYRLGKIRELKIDYSFDLSQQKRNKIYENKAIYIGNSCQSLHPVAGQGLNLSFRQISKLGKYISNIYNIDYSINASINTSIDKYIRDIKQDRDSIMLTTSIMSNIFSFPVKACIGKILNIIDGNSYIKQKFAMHFMYGTQKNGSIK